MFDRIRDRLRKAEEKLDHFSNAQREQFAFARLQQLFPKGFFPPLTTWSISPGTMLFVCNEIAVAGRRCVVEFGSGFSTFCIASLIHHNHPGVRFISIESDGKWMEEVDHSLEKLGCRDSVKLVHAPITDLPAQYAHTPPQKWYDSAVVQAALKEEPLVDLLLVDGPFGRVSPYARYPAVPVLRNRLAEVYSIFLDDSNRPQETEIAARWTTELACTRTDYERFTCLRTGDGFDPTPYGF